MGLFSNLVSRTGGGKLMAAQNALVAKHMYFYSAKSQRLQVDNIIREILVSGGIPSKEVDEMLSRLTEECFFGMAAMAFYNLGISPTLKKVMFRDNWNSINNPLVALSGAEREVEMVASDIRRIHGIIITLEDKPVLNSNNMNTTSHSTELFKTLDQTTEKILVSLFKILSHFNIERDMFECGVFVPFLISNSYYQACLYLKIPAKIIEDILDEYNNALEKELFKIIFPEHNYDSDLYIEMQELIAFRHTEYFELMPDMISCESSSFSGICSEFANNIGIVNNPEFNLEITLYFHKALRGLTRCFIENNSSHSSFPQNDRIKFFLQKEL